MRLEIDLAGDQQVSRDLLRFAHRIDDASPAFEQIADDLAAGERRQFDTEGAYGSAGWAPLAPSTVRRKAMRGEDPRILRATGRLMASLTGTGTDHVKVVQPHQLVFGTTVPYAKYHQHGTGRMPRRRPLEPPERDRRQMVRTLQKFLVDSDPARGGAFRW